MTAPMPSTESYTLLPARLHYDQTATPRGSDEAVEASAGCAGEGGEAACADGFPRLSVSVFAPEPATAGGLSIFAWNSPARPPSNVDWACVAVLLRECGKAIGRSTVGSTGSGLACCCVSSDANGTAERASRSGARTEPHGLSMYIDGMDGRDAGVVQGLIVFPDEYV